MRAFFSDLSCENLQGILEVNIHRSVQAHGIFFLILRFILSEPPATVIYQLQFIFTYPGNEWFVQRGLQAFVLVRFDSLSFAYLSPILTATICPVIISKKSCWFSVCFFLLWVGVTASKCLHAGWETISLLHLFLFVSL